MEGDASFGFGEACLRVASQGHGRRLLALAWPHRASLALATLFLLIGSGLGLAYPKLVGLLVDWVSEARTSASVDRVVALMVVVFAVQAVAVGLRYWLFTVVGERIVADLRQRLFARLLSQEIAFFDQERTGELLNRLSADTAVLQNTVTANLSMALRSLATVLGAIVLLFWTSASLTLLMLILVPPAALGAVYYGRAIRRLSREVQDALARATEVAEETLSGIRTVRVFDREREEAARFARRVDDSFRLASRRAWVTGLFTSAAFLLGYGVIAVVLWRGGRLVLSEAMSMGDLTAFVLYTLLMAVSLATLAGLYGDFMRAVGAATRVFELLDREPQGPAAAALAGDVFASSPAQGPVGSVRRDVIAEDEAQAVGERSLQGQVSFSAVHFAYPARPDVPVLQDVSFSISPGEVVALVGPSGSGKSTVVGLLTRLYAPTGGDILLDGQSIATWPLEQLRSQIAVVSQEPVLFSSTIAENIRYGRSAASDEEVWWAAGEANAAGFIRELPDALQTSVGERGVQLSGGQRQRIAIARALLRDPRLLLLDEATSALDTESERSVQEALERLMVGRTTLVVAHRLSTIRHADRIVVLDKGRVVEEGTHDALTQRGGLYARLAWQVRGA
mgnify:CR=1 FL=1